MSLRTPRSTGVRNTRSRSSPSKPLARPTIATLAKSRLASHSHGPGRVSSKSLRSKPTAFSPRVTTEASPTYGHVRITSFFDRQAHARTNLSRRDEPLDDTTRIKGSTSA